MSCDTTARVLQKANITACESMSAVNLLKQTLQRTRDEVTTMDAAACEKAENLQLKRPTEKRRTKTPMRLRHDGEQGARKDDKVRRICLHPSVMGWT